MRKSPGGVLIPDRSDWRNGFARHGPGPFGPVGRPRGRSRRPGAPWWLPPIGGGAAKTYAVWNGATAALTAATTKVATGTTIKTLIQLQWPSTSQGARVVEWGISFDAVNTTPVQCELIETGAINATVTAFAAGDIVKMNGPNDQATLATLSTSTSGFTGSAEGTITATRLGDYQLVAQQFVKQFPQGREFEVPVSKNLRVRVTAAVTSGAICYVVWEE